MSLISLYRNYQVMNLFNELNDSLYLRHYAIRDKYLEKLDMKPMKRHLILYSKHIGEKLSVVPGS